MVKNYRQLKQQLFEKREEMFGIEYLVNPSGRELEGYVHRAVQKFGPQLRDEWYVRGMVDLRDGTHYFWEGGKHTHNQFSRKVLGGLPAEEAVDIGINKTDDEGLVMAIFSHGHRETGSQVETEYSHIFDKVFLR